MDQPQAPDSKRDRLISALLLFLPLTLWPAATAVSAWSEGAMPSFVLAMLGVVLAAIPAIATALGFGWARKLAEAFALGGMAIGILYVLRNGVTLLAVPAVGYFVVYAFLSHERFRKEGKPAKAAEPPSAEHPLAWLKENVEAIAVAFIMALVIRCFCVEVFKIPSSSMEPTLLGDSPADGRGGDRIMVTKLTYGVQDVRRFEPVVFKFPLNPMKNYIKRVVGLPNERFVLYRGNVYAAPGLTGEAVYRIQRKSLRVQRSVWIPSWTRDNRPLLQSSQNFEAHFTPEGRGTATLRDGALSGGGPGSVTWNAIKIDDSHLGGLGMGVAEVNDLLFEGDLALQKGDGRFWIRIEHDFGPFELRLSPSGGSELIRDKKSTPLATPAFPVGKTVHVEFMVFDGQAFVLFDGRTQAELVFQETLDEAVDRASRRDHRLAFGAEGVPFVLTNLRVAQDIHYKPKDDGLERSMTPNHPLKIDAGCFFMLGDNVNNSHDGRAWRKFTVKLEDGRVIEWESQARVNRTEAKQAWARRHGRDREPDIYIESDIHGHEQGIYREEIARETDIPAPFVKGEFIIGRAFAVCWPLSRSMRLIR